MENNDRAEQEAWLRGQRAEAQKILARRGVGNPARWPTGDRLSFTVTEAGRDYRVYVFWNGRTACSCEDAATHPVCRHGEAALLQATRSGDLRELTRRKATLAGEEMLKTLDAAFGVTTEIRTEWTLHADVSDPMKPRLSLGLRMGDERLYALRSIDDFLERRGSGRELAFGKGFVYQPAWMRFSDRDEKLVREIETVAEALGSRTMGASGLERHVPIAACRAVSVLDLLAEGGFILEIEGRKSRVREIREGYLPMRFQLSTTSTGIMVQGACPKTTRLLTGDGAYVTAEERVLRIPREQRALLLWMMRNGDSGQSVMEFPKESAPKALAELVPVLTMCGAVEMEASLRERLVREPLRASVYLDRAGSGIRAKVSFSYGAETIDPFQPIETGPAFTRGEKLLLRDALGEKQVLDTLDGAGFRVRREGAYLTGDDSLYLFLTEGLGRLREVAELYLSRDFKDLQPRRPRLNARVGMRSGRLLVHLAEEAGEITADSLALMQALAQKRDYFRLQDGSFLDLRGLEDWQGAAQTIAESAAADALPVSKDGAIELQGFRAAYLSSVLDEAKLPVEKEDSFLQMVRVMSEEDAEEEDEGLPLRSYQKRGVHWLLQLDRLHMGGILADDMGLGKTIQTIALMRHVRGEGLTLVVCPTSLCYHWLTEIQRFAPEISAAVLSGTAAQRESLLRHAQEAGDIDVLITSYPLIRRDVGDMQGMRFRLVIADEAQQIKNAGSVAAAAVKQLQADTRFALTGTPMENGAGELWSLYDFVLPGYLGGYTAFMRRYQEGEDADDLRRRIRPFLMRRLKKDVLTELPDKQEMILTAHLTPEQEKVYRASLQRLRDRVERVMADKGLARGRVEVLAAITELRQICCHPALVMDDYMGSSGKLELLMDILPGALQGGHRALLFSQFTSMLRLIRRHLEAAGIRCMYLDGSTPADERLSLCERFNAGEGDVFLISLKAGGTGLNLVGADRVIHYDPWWNPAAEDQATDRAHRIGQTHKVEVLRLVTHGTIEEQVVELGERKRALFDKLITPGEELVTALSEQDIRRLFEG